jgi:hypothetical protein
MSRGRSLALAATALVAAVVIPAPIAAHRAHISLTIVEWNARTGALEVVHRVHLHDAQRALDHLVPERNLGLADLEGRARFALYVEEAFSLTLGGGGSEIPLELVGAEIERDDILVYQEAALPAPPSELRVECSILRDLFDDQVNHVNLSTGEGKRTLRFTGEDEAKTARLRSGGEEGVEAAE